MEEIYKKVGIRVRMARAEAALTQAMLGERIAMSGVQIHRIEQGDRRITLADLMALAETLHKPITWFLSEDSSPPRRGRTSHINSVSILLRRAPPGSAWRDSGLPLVHQEQIWIDPEKRTQYTVVGAVMAIQP